MKKGLHLKHSFTFLTLLILLMNVSIEGHAQCSDAAMYASTASVGNEAYSQRLGSVFTITTPIVVTHLGAFDDNFDGLKRVITVGIVRVSDGATVVPSTFLVGGNPISLPLEGSYRMKAIPNVTLPPGQYCIVAVGYGATERDGNEQLGGGYPFTSFNGPAGFTADYSMYGGAGFGLPTTIYNTPPTQGQVFHAGNFKFQYGTVPVLTTCPGNMTVNNDQHLCSKTVNYIITASGLPAPTYSYAFSGATTGSGSGTGSGSIFNKGTTSVAVTVTNSCGSVTCFTNITVLDNEAPQINCPQGLGVSCAGDVPAHATDSLSFAAQGGTINDNCVGPITVTWISDVISNQSPTCPNSYTITRTYRATDNANNSALCSQLITVNDLTPPLISCPQGLTVPCSGDIPAPFGDINSFLAAGGTVSDNCGGAVTVSWAGDVTSDSSCPNKKTILRTYKAVDACGNSATCNETIIVNDNVAPNITPPAAVTVQCASAVPTPFADLPSFIAGGGTVNDNCTGTLTFGWVAPDLITNSSCVNKFILTRTYRIADACGNSAICHQQITVNDNTNPVIIAPASVVINCQADTSATPGGTGVATATDNCGTVFITHTNQRNNGNCQNNYLILRRWTATDACGNHVTQLQVIRVIDTTRPIISCPGPASYQCTSAVPGPARDSLSFVAAGGTVSDNCTGPVIVTWTGDVSMDSSCPNKKTINRTYKAVDGCGNSSTCTQVLTINDNTPPVIHCATTVTVECPSQVPPHATDSLSFVTGGGTVSDNCTGQVFVNWVGDATNPDPSGNCEYVITRTYKATDGCGNSATCQQTIGIHHVTHPSEFTIPGNPPVPTSGTVQCWSSAVAPGSSQQAPPLPVIKDVCGTVLIPIAGSPAVSGTAHSNADCSGTVIYTFNYVDCAGLTATWTYTYTLLHTTAPVIPADGA